MSVSPDTKNIYGNFGIFKPNSWKTDSDKLFTPDNAVSVFTNLKDLGLIPTPDKPFTFLSPSASYGSHEHAMWQLDSGFRQADNLFIASDLLEQSIPSHYKSERKGRHRFQFLRADGFELPFTNNSVDLIWDRKGCLWHAADQPNFAAEVEVLDLIREYKRVLKPGGLVVIDNNPNYVDFPNLKVAWKLFIVDLFRTLHFPALYTPEKVYQGTVSQYEPSTVDMLRKNFPKFWGRISSDFGTVGDIGSNELRFQILRLKNYEEKQLRRKAT